MPAVLTAAGCQPYESVSGQPPAVVIQTGPIEAAKPEKPVVPGRPAVPALPVLTTVSSSVPPGTPAAPAPVASGSIPIAAPTASTGPSCSAQLSFHSAASVGVSVSAGVATVQWPSSYDPVIQSWRVIVVPNSPIPTSAANALRVVTVAPTGLCMATLSATVSGLTRGHSYVFWLDAIVNNNESGGTVAHNVGHSNPVTA
ncbi:hypothetical protein M6D93_11045 [Jatrophihabitans telluris]|uniref:Fibronectin type-III domain-containing protein n=1 Tax=Jatrophihabitans telluris TaxID=2038343 RepID=A0ABY4QV48_9ACTN|nr:hypothetical protein [Jatrophihabitans telluris]UQX86844.1 hypothetical protein M6D93_11045 [Jatrophihabitans telluris]